MRVSGSPLTTQITYIRSLRDLMEDCGDLPEHLTVERIKTHLSGLRDILSSSALHLRVCGIKYYFRHVVKRLDLVVDVPNPRVAKYVQEVLSEADLSVLFAACTSMRELALLHLLYDCGLRSREVCELKLSDFDKIHRKLTIRKGKGNRIRTIPYSEALRTTLTQYFKSLKTPPTVYLFENKEVVGQGITIRGVQYIVKEVLKRSRLKKEVHPHTFRHSFAVHYIDNGGSLLRLKELLGHERIDTTLHYLKFCKIPLQETPTPLEAMLNRQKREKR